MPIKSNQIKSNQITLSTPLIKIIILVLAIVDMKFHTWYITYYVLIFEKYLTFRIVKFHLLADAIVFVAVLAYLIISPKSNGRHVQID